MAARADRLRDARLELRAGGAGPGAGRARRDARSRAIPFLHFFDGFRTSHEVAKIDAARRRRHARADRRRARARAPRPRALARAPDDPRHGAEPRRLLPGPRGGEPVLPRRARRSCSRRWTRSPRAPAATTASSTTSARPTPSASSSLMGSGAETAARDRRGTSLRAGEKVGAVKVRLFRPFSVAHFLAALPPTRADASPCSTAPRSRAAPASRSTSTSSPRVARERPPDPRRSAAATGSARRSSRPRW